MQKVNAANTGNLVGGIGLASRNLTGSKSTVKSLEVIEAIKKNLQKAWAVNQTRVLQL